MNDILGKTIDSSIVLHDMTMNIDIKDIRNARCDFINITISPDNLFIMCSISNSHAQVLIMIQDGGG